MNCDPQQQLVIRRQAGGLNLGPLLDAVFAESDAIR